MTHYEDGSVARACEPVVHAPDKQQRTVAISLIKKYSDRIVAFFYSNEVYRRHGLKPRVCQISRPGDGLSSRAAHTATLLEQMNETDGLSDTSRSH